MMSAINCMSPTTNPDTKSGVSLTASGYASCQPAISGRKTKLPNTPPSMTKVISPNNNEMKNCLFMMV
jgi:hypothetical protein